MISRQQNASACLLAALICLISSPVGARNQWDINHGASNPTPDPRFAPGGSMSGYMPKGSAIQGFWQGQIANRIPAGTVLTGILEHDLSSAKNNVGDTFTITLEDGYSTNGNSLIPPLSKIIGSVSAVTPAASLRGGHPGRMDISLQALVFPDGSHMPIHAIVDGNPVSVHKGPPQKRNLGVAISDYGESVSAFGASFIGGIGAVQAKRNRGLDFVIDSGEAIPLRLTSSLDLPQQARERMVSGSPMGGAPMGGAPINGSFNNQSPYPQSNGGGAVPGLVDPSGPVYIPPAPVRSQGMQQQQQQPYPGAQPGYGGNAPQPYQDQNPVFAQPVNPQPLNEFPDPF